MLVRPARADEVSAVARVHDACWRAAYTGMLPAALIARSALADREALWAALLRVPLAERCAHAAEDAHGRIIGCAWGGPEESGDPRYRGELLGLYLLRDFRGRGLGRALVRAVVASLRAQGYPNLLLWALADNHPARGFYLALGGAMLREREVTMRGVPIREVAYGWPDSALLLAPEGKAQRI